MTCGVCVEEGLPNKPYYHAFDGKEKKKTWSPHGTENLSQIVRDCCTSVCVTLPHEVLPDEFICHMCLIFCKLYGHVALLTCHCCGHSVCVRVWDQETWQVGKKSALAESGVHADLMTSAGFVYMLLLFLKAGGRGGGGKLPGSLRLRTSSNVVLTTATIPNSQSFLCVQKKPLRSLFNSLLLCAKQDLRLPPQRSRWEEDGSPAGEECRESGNRSGGGG